MISILSKNGSICLMVDKEEVSFYENLESLISMINENYIEYQRNYKPNYKQRRIGYKALEINEQEEIEAIILNYDREQNGFSKEEMYFDEEA